MPEKEKNINDLVWDRASAEILGKAKNDNIDTCFARFDTQKNHCKFGTSGLCCRICHMGPCRITKNAPLGVCGADADTIVARNYLRQVVGGTAAHSDHGRHLVLRLKKVAEGKGGGFRIKDEKALQRAAKNYKIETEGRTTEQVALDLANLWISDYTSQEEILKTVSLAPVTRQNTWKNNNILPVGIDRLVVEAMHRTHMGVDHDYKNILMSRLLY